MLAAVLSKRPPGLAPDSRGDALALLSAVGDVKLALMLTADTLRTRASRPWIRTWCRFCLRGRRVLVSGSRLASGTPSSANPLRSLWLSSPGRV